MRFQFIPSRATGLVLALALSACGTASLDDSRFPTGSQTLTTSSDYSRVYVVNVDAGTVSVMTAAGETISTVDVGISPTRLARVGSKVLVTLRGERGVAVLQETADGLSLERVLEVGAEPVGVVGSEDGTLAYVALSQQDEVIELDMSTLTVARTFSVPDQPAFLALHPSGRALYVGSSMHGTFTHISLSGDGRVETLALPQMSRFKNRSVDFFDVLGIDGPVAMSNRITGDLAVSPDGKYIAIPVLALDNTSPADNENGDQIEGGGGYASSTGGGIGRFNPSVVIVPSGSSGTPGLEDAVSVFAAGTDVRFQDLRSYINSVTFSPDGMTIMASMEGSDAIVVIPQNVKRDGKRSTDEFDERQTTAIVTGAGPSGIAFVSESQAFVHNFLDNEVADTNFDEAFQRLVHTLSSDKRKEDVGVPFVEPSDNGESHMAVMAHEGVAVSAETLPTDVADGRRMFFAALDERVAVKGGGVSCATCHFEGRNDGVTWQFMDGKARQTPSLAGDLSFQDRFTWTDNVPSVAAEARLTSVDRMGGSGLSITESRKIEAFVNATWYPDTLLAGVDDNRTAAGKAIFEREDVGCATCHSGEQYTDQVGYTMLGLEDVRTPTLLGIAATGPYLHDGRAASLEQVLQVSDMGAMGDTSMLTDEEKSDLVYYLKSL